MIIRIVPRLLTATPIAPLLSRLTHSQIFFEGSLKKEGREYSRELPVTRLKAKEKPKDPEKFDKKELYSLIDYQKKDRLPNCRYYSLEYNNRIYHVYNAFYYPMGRMINRVAAAIRGRNSPHYKPSQADVKNGDICVIVNIDDPLLTGKKLRYKTLHYHTGFVGHLKTHKYRDILNRKPELLYHYLLRKAMPKNKLSEKYMENVVLVRGHTHDFPHLPQFAPDKKIYELLPEVNLPELVRKDPSFKIIKESSPGIAKKKFGRDVEEHLSEADRRRMESEKEEKLEDPRKLLESENRKIEVSVLHQRKYEVAARRERHLELRHKPYRAPYKAPYKPDIGLELFTSEKKARKHPKYNILADNDSPEAEDNPNVPNPHYFHDEERIEAPKDPKKK